MKNTLITSYTNQADGLQGRVWLTVNGKWLVTYHDTDAGEQLPAFRYFDTREAAQNDANSFAFGRPATSVPA